MKYIRTKDGKIIDTSLALDSEPTNHNLMRFKSKNWLNGHKQITIKVDNIIAQADTIEELCDEFVFIDEFFKREHRLAYSLENALARCKYHDVDITTLRGAIWTNKGLIYVAKMNEKGELELL